MVEIFLVQPLFIPKICFETPCFPGQCAAGMLAVNSGQFSVDAGRKHESALQDVAKLG